MGGGKNFIDIFEGNIPDFIHQKAHENHLQRARPTAQSK